MTKYSRLCVVHLIMGGGTRRHLSLGVLLLIIFFHFTSRYFLIYVEVLASLELSSLLAAARDFVVEHVYWLL